MYHIIAVQFHLLLFPKFKTLNSLEINKSAAKSLALLYTQCFIKPHTPSNHYSHHSPLICPQYPPQQQHHHHFIWRLKKVTILMSFFYNTFFHIAPQPSLETHISGLQGPAEIEMLHWAHHQGCSLHLTGHLIWEVQDKNQENHPQWSLHCCTQVNPTTQKSLSSGLMRTVYHLMIK